MGRFKSSVRTLFCFIELPPDGADIMLAIPEIKRSTITKKSPKAVRVPSIDAKKLFRKFMLKLLVLQI